MASHTPSLISLPSPLPLCWWHHHHSRLLPWSPQGSLLLPLPSTSQPAPALLTPHMEAPIQSPGLSFTPCLPPISCHGGLGRHTGPSFPPRCWKHILCPVPLPHGLQSEVGLLSPVHGPYHGSHPFPALSSHVSRPLSAQPSWRQKLPGLSRSSQPTSIEASGHLAGLPHTLPGRQIQIWSHGRIQV